MLTDRQPARPGRPRPAPARPAVPAPPAATAARSGVPGRRLFGALDRDGFSLRWHDGEVEGAAGPDDGFVADTVELWLNLDGEARLEAPDGKVEMGPLTAAFLCVGGELPRACPVGRGRHRFVRATFARRHLAGELASQSAHLHPLIGPVLEPAPLRTRLGPVRPLTPAQRQLALALRRPPVADAALALWYRCKAHELVAQCFFRTAPGETFCTRQNRLADERVRKVVARLREDLVNPPSLKELGREVGCSPFHLSRIFSRQTGLTIPQYLRHLRLHRAAELLRDGRHNVTEAAMAVGYNSLSHFSLAFHETFGCCPGLYPWGVKEPGPVS